MQRGGEVGTGIGYIILTCSQVECLKQVGTSPVNFTRCNISCNLFVHFFHPLSNHVSIFSMHPCLGTSFLRVNQMICSVQLEVQDGSDYVSGVNMFAQPYRLKKNLDCLDCK